MSGRAVLMATCSLLAFARFIPAAPDWTFYDPYEGDGAWVWELGWPFSVNPE